MQNQRVTPLALRAKEAAECLGISERTLARLKASGQLAFVRVGNVVLFPVKSLEAWLEGHSEGVTV
ncbi:MAG: helix-turn-helix domain-containing protein [Planctomycetaceae bacterium]